MKKHIILLAILHLLSLQLLNAQNFQWAKGYGGTKPDISTAIYTDQNGNNLITGYFYSSTVFFDTLSLNCNGRSNIFILKTDPLGNIIWLKKAGGSDINYGSTASDIIKNNNNDIYITGGFGFSAVFDTVNIIGFGYMDAYLAKYNDAGHCLWTKKMGGSGGDIGLSVCIIDNQNILVCGDFNSPNAYFDTIVLHNTGGVYINKLFLAKYNDNGKCLWAKQSSSGLADARKVINNNSQIIVTGSYQDSLTIQGVTGLSSSITDANIFIVAFDMYGNLKWFKTAGGKGTDIANSICFDSLGNCYVTGIFNDTATFNTQSIMAGSLSGDMFIAKYDSLGNLLWVKNLNCSGAAEGKDIIPDGNNGFYVTGYFSGTALFGTNSISALSAQDMFIAHYDKNGNCIGIRNVANSSGNAISLDNNGNCVIAGTFTNTTNFDGINLTSYGWNDIFFAKLDAITGISKKSMENYQLIIYANPTTGKCNITMPDEFVNEENLILYVYDNTGNLIQKQNIAMKGNKIRLNLEAEAKGIYTATLSNGKKMYTGKIVFE